MIAPDVASPPRTLRVMLSDDSVESRAANRQLLQATVLDLAGESDLGIRAATVAREVHPDIVLVSVEQPVSRGLQTIEALSAVLPETPIVALSGLTDRDSLRRAMLAGARDYLVPPLDRAEIEQSLISAYEGERKRRATSRDGLESRQGGQVVTVYGAKGGIGRTTLACNLAVALALNCNQRTVLVDLDLQFGDVGLLLNVPPDRTVADLLEVMDKLDAEFVRGFLTTHASGLSVLPAPVRPEDGEKVQASHIQEILQVLARTFDYVIVDAPRQLSDNVIATLDLSNLVYLVTSDELSGLKSTTMCLQIMRGWHYSEDKLKLIINQAHAGTGLPSEEVSQAIDYPVLWKVPYDGQAIAASRWGSAFVQSQPKAKISRNIIALAQALSGTPVRPKSFVSRLRGR